MGIVQEDRLDFIQPAVSVTDYGAEYVKAGTETPAAVDLDGGDKDQPEEKVEEAVAEQPVNEEEQAAEQPTEESIEEETREPDAEPDNEEAPVEEEKPKKEADAKPKKRGAGRPKKRK